MTQRREERTMGRNDNDEATALAEIERLAHLREHGETSTERIAAADELLDRAEAEGLLDA